MWLRFNKSGNVFRPFDIFELTVVIEVEIVELSIMKLRVQNISNQFINIFHLTIHIFLKHTKPFILVKHLESSDPPQHFHRFIGSRVIDTVVGIFVEYVQN